MKKSISPIIATILLIIMTIGIAALMYTWMTGMFTQLTTQAGQQIGGIGAVSFIINRVVGVDESKGEFKLSITNNGRVAINFNQNTAAVRLTEYDILTGRLVSITSCTPSDLQISPGDTRTLTVNCNKQINIANYVYSIEVTYFGVTSSVTYP